MASPITIPITFLYWSCLDFFILLKSRGFLIFVLANQASNSSHVQSTRQRYNKNEILPHLSVAKRVYICQSRLSEVIPCILYKLKTGCQWYMLPVSSFFAAEKLDLAYLINSYIEYKEEFELTKCFLSINTYFKKRERLGMSWKRYVGLMKFLRIWRCWIGKGCDEWDLLKERIWSTTLFYN